MAAPPRSLAIRASLGVAIGELIVSCQRMESPKPTLRLLGRTGELVVSIDARSWLVLDEPDLFPEGVKLRRTFGVDWAGGLFRESPHGIFQSMSAAQFRQGCEAVWQSLLRDRELLSYSYLYEFGREKGVRHGGGMGGGFHVRGLVDSIKARPKGYCTVGLASLQADRAIRPR